MYGYMKQGMQQFQQFQFPSSLQDIQTEDPTLHKKAHSIIKYINFMSETLIFEPEKLWENANWFEFTYYSIKQNLSALSRTLAEMMKNQLDKAHLGQLSKSSEKITLFLTMCFLCWNTHSPLDHQKLLKGFVKYINNCTSESLYDCFTLIVSVAVANINNFLGHSIVAILLKNADENQFKLMVNAFSSPNLNILPLLRRLNLQRVENEDTDTQQKFQELVQSSNSYFIECIIQNYLNQVNTLYSKQNRETVLLMTKHLNEQFQKKSLLHSLLKYYDKINYFIRNTSTLSLGELLKKSIFDEQTEEKLIQLLINRTHDTHVHSRSCVLYIIRDLLKSKAIGYHDEFLAKGQERLRDRSAFGRKAAVCLLNEIIIYFYRTYGQSAFRLKLVKDLENKVEERKRKLIDECLQFQDQLTKQELDLRQNLDELEIQLNQTREQELGIKQQLLFHTTIQQCLNEIKSIALSKSTLESSSALKTLQTLLKYHYEGIIQVIKQILILVYSKDSNEEIVQLIYNEFGMKHYKLIQLIEICDQLELVSLEEIFKQIKLKRLIIKDQFIEQVWQDLQQGRYILSNLRILKYLGCTEQLELLLRLQIGFEESIEILQIIKQIENEEIHLIFIQKVLQLLLSENTPDIRQWFKCCECVLRIIVEQIKKPEIIIQSFLNQLNPKNIAYYLYANSTAQLKLYVYSDKLINEYQKEKQIQQQQDELDMIDGSIQEHLEQKQKQLLSVFDTSSSMQTCENICKSITSDTYRERDILIDQMAVMSLLQYMVTSQECTSRNISMIFQILECQQVQSIIKSNILVGISDIYYRYPQFISVERLLARMDDDNIKVRRTAIIIISHLMLMELLKIDVSHIAKHINDSDTRIKVHVKIFFIELYRKDPQKLYQILPDLITSMAHNRLVSQDDFKIFSSEIIPIIEKDKIAEQILSKFIARFEVFAREANQKSDNLQRLLNEGTQDVISFNPILLTANQESKYLSYCLVHLKYHVDNLRILIQNFNSYKTHLKDPEIFESFKQIYTKCRKVAITQKIHSKTKQNNPEYDQLLQQYKSLLQTIDPTFEKNIIPMKQKKVHQQPILKRPQQQQYDTDESSSMEIE